MQSYLERISFGDEPTPTLDVLGRLLACHVQSIPFENIDVQLGRPLTLDPADAHEKIVNSRRGGWCYEQNGLFGWALAEIGYETTRIAADVMRVERNESASANHLCLLVKPVDVDRRYLVDVGFGGSMIAPIPLQESEYDQAPFKIGLRRAHEDSWQFWEDLGKGEFSFDFEAKTADEDALRTRCEFLQTDPSSSFVQNLVAQIRLPEEHKTLRGKVYSRATAAGIESRTLASPDELIGTLNKVFHLDVPEVADLWPRIEARHDELLREKALTDTYEVRTRSHDKSLS